MSNELMSNDKGNRARLLPSVVSRRRLAVFMITRHEHEHVPRTRTTDTEHEHASQCQSSKLGIPGKLENEL